MNSNTTPATGDFEPLLVSRSMAARLLDLSERSIDLLIKDGRLCAVRVGGRVLISNTALHEFALKGSDRRIRTRRS